MLRSTGIVASGLLGLGVTMAVLAAPTAAAPPKAVPAVDPQAVEFFETKVRPVLAENCFSCHGSEKQQAGLRLDSREALQQGSENGPVVKAGEPDRSPLIRAIRHDADPKMPPKSKLPDEKIAALTAWVKMGAHWPETVAKDMGKTGTAAIVEARQKHWAFQPVKMPAVPAVKNPVWIATPIDAYILSTLEDKGLTPSKPTDRRTLIRRVTFDLIGLPPTLEEVLAFEKDTSPDAYAKVIDRLLASPHYGERWGRHWLDVARYADTKGYVFQEERRYPYSYTYRDYVIHAFNEDLPYDRFIVEQLAADQLPLREDKRPLAAMGFLTLGRRFLNNQQDIIDDRIDVVTRGLMGLTVSCARCHDHKFDPIPTKDYYSLYGVFASSIEPKDLPLIAEPERNEAYLSFEKELSKRENAVSELMNTKQTELMARYRSQSADYMLASRQPGENQVALNAGALNGAFGRRWQAYLRETQKHHHPIFAPWNAFAALPREDFVDQAPALAAKFATNDDPKNKLNALVARAFAGEPPASLRDVAKIYGELFTQADKLWQVALQEANEGMKPAPTALHDPDQEALRQVLYGPGAPANFTFAEAESGRFIDRATRDKVVALRKRVDQWKATSPNAPPRAMVLNDAPTPTVPHVLLRGNPSNPGEAVPRQFLQVLAGEQRKPFRHGSGRLELAEAIASRDNPLTARVLVNRLWVQHFGAGLVRSPSQFGFRGEPPSHPELLDYLAATFMDNGWSIKHVHRMVLLSNAYQQSSADNAHGKKTDPENRLLWKMNRQRLDFEEMRDALLAVSGRLDLKIGGAAVDLTKTPFTSRRTVYGFIDRQNLPGLFRTFDFASPDSSSAQRHVTTVPQQALFLMNSPFVVEHARHLLERPDIAQNSDENRIKHLYQLLYGRPAQAEELALGLRFLWTAQEGAGPDKTEPKAAQALTAWEKYVQVLLLANEFAFLD